ncbi:PREDICTED: CAR1 transcription factor-like [Ceratosolen solmsi marchali]|uniref:CAR1 transcription factor-like n=1 Tax=Ceratosolen solmsi marchali TaxID=326594 RepID=A0AAJ6YBP5_9HYME|nr:PREDICTED: CAR1 transcription factor-like [Ceratosolen solmsi marchali]
MRLTRSTLVQITCILMVEMVYVQGTLEVKSKSTDNIENHRIQFPEEISANGVFDENSNDDQLPILPPIILLDFVNGTSQSFNFTNLNDDKSKRTIDVNLGYGFNQNNLFNGKHNLYFPAGKTGTAVSIEESISPFEPKTVTEIIKPISEQIDANVTHARDKSKPSVLEALPDPLPLQNGREPLPIYPPYPPYGQRTKLQKTSSQDSGQQARRPPGQFTKSHPTNPGLENYNTLFATYASMKPAGYQASPSHLSASGNTNNYARPMTSHYLNNYITDIYSNSGISNGNGGNTITTNSGTNNQNSERQEYNLANYPRYTVENGIKYEHKIVWKYPDGKISETPPMSYVNSYSEYAEQHKVNGANADNSHVSNDYQFNPVIPKQEQNAQGNSYTSYTADAQNNVYSQKPVQFPINQEQSIGDNRKEQSKFISSSSAAVPTRNHYESVNTYNPTNYQGQYGLRQNPKYNSRKPIINHKIQDATYNNHRPTTKYIVSNPDSELSYQAENVQENLFSPNGQINKEVLAKYSPEAQNYLMKVFSSGKTTIKNNHVTEDTGNYANTDYSHLLNYNPSITQYIKNPSSILNAQPTFVQVGNSLVPVIILRVDGAPPIQPKVGSNINLKALLRQYLTQYATSVSKGNENTNYNLGNVMNVNEASLSQSNPVEDLKHLTESLASLRQRGYRDPDFTENYTRSYVQQSQPSYHDNSQATQDYSTNYNRFVKDYQKIHAGQQTRKSQTKVKNVQIIEDPRYPGYKYNN